MISLPTDSRVPCSRVTSWLHGIGSTNSTQSAAFFPTQQPTSFTLRAFPAAHGQFYATPDAKLEGARTHREEFIGTVDVWQLKQVRWPIVGVLATRYIDHLELTRYVRGLLSSGRRRNVHAVPHIEEQHRHERLYDLYGEPNEPDEAGGSATIPL